MKYPSAYLEIRDNDGDMPPWNTSADVFLPLFDAYDASKF